MKTLVHPSVGMRLLRVGLWKSPRKMLFLLHWSAGVRAPSKTQTSQLSKSGGISGPPPKQEISHCHQSCSQCWLMVQAWPAMSLPKTEVSCPHLLPGHRAYFAATDLQVEKEASAYCQKLQASSLACDEKRNYHFFVVVVLVDTMYF